MGMGKSKEKNKIFEGNIELDEDSNDFSPQERPNV